MFMSGLAKREGWRGPVDASMIRAAANQAGKGLPEGKRLLRLAGAIEAAQAAINRPYFPAMRFGDYFIAVKPKIGTEENSLGGYPKVEWFETVEKPVLQDMLGKSRLPAADTPGVKEALDRIRAMTKGDGSLAFTDETHDFRDWRSPQPAECAAPAKHPRHRKAVHADGAGCDHLPPRQDHGDEYPG
jgi:hypothetical protein